MDSMALNTIKVIARLRRIKKSLHERIARAKEWSYGNIFLSVQKPTGRIKAAEKYGRRFIEQFKTKTIRPGIHLGIGASLFESDRAVIIYSNGHAIGEARIGFDREGVVVEAIQGMNGVKMELDEVKKKTGQSWTVNAVRAIEETAKEIGMRTVKIRLPETLYYYRRPVVSESPMSIHEVQEAIRARMRATYRSTARELGYREKKRFFVKYL